MTSVYFAVQNEAAGGGEKNVFVPFPKRFLRMRTQNLRLLFTPYIMFRYPRICYEYRRGYFNNGRSTSTDSCERNRPLFNIYAYACILWLHIHFKLSILLQFLLEAETTESLRSSELVFDCFRFKFLYTFLRCDQGIRFQKCPYNSLVIVYLLMQILDAYISIK